MARLPKSSAGPSGPAVTVYVANYNYGRFIEKAIDSVLAQTLKDFEVIVIDDGSTDDSRDIIQRYADKGLVVPVFQKNRGLTVTNNIALRMARGRFIMRLDADDWLDEHALHILAGVLDRSTDVDMVFPDYHLVDKDGGVTDIVRRHDFSEVTLMDQPAHGACTMIRCETLLNLGGYNESLKCQDGYDLWIRFIARHKVQNVNLPLFYYRQHGSSLTRDESRILNTRSKILAEAAERLGGGLNIKAVIPVRGRIFDPHSIALRPLGGKPLIEWTIDAAKAARAISEVIVTTPDPEVAAHIARRYGETVRVVRRDRSLAQLNTFADAAVLIALSHGEEAPPDAVAVLFIESPFRGADKIDAAADVLRVFGTDAVIGVRPENDPIYAHNGSGLQAMRTGRVLRLEAEDLYKRCGDLEIMRYSYLQQRAAGLDPAEMRVGHVIVDEKAALCLRSELDWSIAEHLSNAD